MMPDDTITITPKGHSAITSLRLAYAREDVVNAVRKGDTPTSPSGVAMAFARYNRVVIAEHKAGRL